MIQSIIYFTILHAIFAPHTWSNTKGIRLLRAARTLLCWRSDTTYSRRLEQEIQVGTHECSYCVAGSTEILPEIIYCHICARSIPIDEIAILPSAY